MPKASRTACSVLSAALAAQRRFSLAQRSLSSRVGGARTKPPAPTHSGAQQDRRAACVGWAHVLFGKKGAYRPAALSASPSLR